MGTGQNTALDGSCRKTRTVMGGNYVVNLTVGILTLTLAWNVHNHKDWNLVRTVHCVQERATTSLQKVGERDSFSRAQSPKFSREG